MRFSVTTYILFSITILLVLRLNTGKAVSIIIFHIETTLHLRNVATILFWVLYGNTFILNVILVTWYYNSLTYENTYNIRLSQYLLGNNLFYDTVHSEF